MKQQEVFKKIGGIIKELNDQYEYLQSVEGTLNELELELFVANSHFLTDHIVILNKLNSQNRPVPKPLEKEAEKPEVKPVDKTSTVHEEKHFEPMVRSVATNDVKPVAEKPQPDLFNNAPERPAPSIDLGSGSGDDTYSFMRTEEGPEETIRHELILDEADTWDDEETEDIESEDVTEEVEIAPEPAVQKAEEPVIPQPEPVAVHSFTPAPAVVAEPVKEEPKPYVQPVVVTESPKKEEKEAIPTINERMSAHFAEKSRAHEHVAQPVSDLKTAITLNDKLLYIKDLFNGYNLAYSEAIDILNRFNSFAEAELFLQKNYVTKNNWDSKPATTEKFYAILKRRYE